MKKGIIISALLIVALVAFIAFQLLSQPDTEASVEASATGEDYGISILDLFDTTTEISGYNTTEERFTEDVAFIKEELTRYNNLYDIYNEYEGINNVKTINDNAGITPVKVDSELIDLIKYGKEMYYETDGKLNIAMGSVLSIWHTYREQGLENPDAATLPTEEELAAASEHTNIEDIIIDEEAGTVYLADTEMSLDVGGIAKGYAVQAVATAAKAHGIDHVLLNVGGNICAIGSKTEDKNFKIGIQNPDLESYEAYIETVEIGDGNCVVSSGDYQRYYEVDGTRYCHIINPDTLFPSTEFAQVSILASDSGMADAFSTALFNMTLEDGQQFIESHEGVEAMWVLKDGTFVYSEGFPSTN